MTSETIQRTDESTIVPDEIREELAVGNMTESACFCFIEVRLGNQCSLTHLIHAFLFAKVSVAYLYDRQVQLCGHLALPEGSTRGDRKGIRSLGTRGRVPRN
jgi:hypothetical protein